MNAKKPDLSGTIVLGRYRIVQPLARGGMGVVYLARTEGAKGFTRPVVVKRIISDLAHDEAAAKAFVREARILANLQHPGIVNVIDFDEEDDAYVMVLEYVHGYNLGQWHRYVVDTRGRMPVDHAIYVMTRVLDALHYAHTFVKQDGTPMQIVHRDVSPGNILVDTQGHVKLLDFGIARAEETDEYKTREGMFKGKLTYAAPEMYDGSTASPRSDVYSAGVVLYQLLVGENPFRGKDMAEIVRRVLTEKLPAVRSRREDVSPELQAALEKALAKDPADRHPTAAAFAEALRAARPNREEAFASELIDDVFNDFNGDMATKLGLEPLADRDAAWRAAQDETATSRTRLSSTPPPDHPTETFVERPGAPQERHPVAKAPAKSGPFAFVAGGVALVALAGAAYAFTRPGPAETPASRFVVVERSTRDDEPSAEPPAAEAPPNATAAAVPSAAPSPVASASVSSPPVKAATVAAAGPAKADPAALSRIVQRQRGQFESCFLQHVKDVDGRPEVSIRFRVADTGRVESAELSPSSLSGTPLGQCILGVARRTEFGPLSESVAFSIPITAHRVK